MEYTPVYSSILHQYSIPSKPTVYRILQYTTADLVVFHLETEPTHPHGSGCGSQLPGRGTNGLVVLRGFQNLQKKASHISVRLD